MATHVEHLVREAQATLGSLCVLLTTGLAEVDEVSLAAASLLGESDDADLLTLASATGRDRADVLEDLASVQPTDRDADAARLAAILVVLEQGFDELEINAIRSQFDAPPDMERAWSYYRGGEDYLGPEGETRALVEELRSRLRSS